MHQPLGFKDLNHPYHVCLLWKYLHGLKQAQEHGTNNFQIMYFLLDSLKVSLTALYFFDRNIHIWPTFFFIWTILFLLLLQMIFTSLSYHDLTLNSLWNTWDHTVTFWILRSLGMMVVYICLEKSIHKKFLNERACHLANYVPLQLTPNQSSNAKNNNPYENPFPYHSLVGAQQCLTFTRPIISYVVQQICIFMHNPMEDHMLTLGRIMWYIHGTSHYGLHLYSLSIRSIIFYTYAD